MSESKPMAWPWDRGRAWAFLAMWFGVTVGLWGQTADPEMGAVRPLSHYMVQTWTSKQGLPINSLLAVAQTPDGYLWISSYDGLARFDGLAFELISDPFLKAASNNVCSDLKVDRNGTLWIGTHGGGLFSFDESGLRLRSSGEQFRHHIHSLFQTPTGRIWVGTIGHGVHALEGNRLIPVELDKWLADKTVSNFARDPHGGVWIATEYHGLVCWKDHTLKLYSEKHGLPGNLVYTLLFDQSGTLWVGTNEGVCRFNGRTFDLLPGTRGQSCRCMAQDQQGSLWLGFDGRICRYASSQSGLETLSNEHGPVTVASKDVFVDREQNIWIATRFGELYRLRLGSVSTLGSRQGLRGKTIYAVIEEKPGTLLAGSNEGFLDVIEKDRARPKGLDKALLGSRIRHLMKDARGRIWISTYSGLLRLERDGRQTWFTEARGFPDQRVRISFQDSRGRIFVGTRGNGLLRMHDDDRIEVVDPDGTLTHALIMSIDEDDRQNLWVGTSGKGLVAIHPDGSSVTFNAGKGFISDIVFNTYCDAESVIWVACNGGVARIENNQSRGFRLQDGLITDTAFDVVEDPHGIFWIPSNLGLMRVPKADFNAIMTEKKTSVSCKLLDKADGVLHPFTATGKILAASDGGLWLPTFDGLQILHPDQIITNSHKPICHIKRVEIDGRVVADWENLVVPPGGRRVRFDFTALSLVAPEKIKFRFQLEGFEGQWSPATSERTVSYTNLKPGNYVFKIKACNNDGVWSETEATLPFFVEPHLFQKTGFQILAAAFLLSLALALVQLRLRNLKLRERELRRLVKERTLSIQKKGEELQTQRDQLRAKNDELKFAYQKIEEISLTDPLTGLRNRRYLQQVIHGEVGRTLRHHEDRRRGLSETVPEDAFMGFILVDLDHFKRVNDTHGHKAGDAVIVQTAGLLTRACRQEDIVVRWGGEEFLIVARAVKRGQLAAVCDRIRQLFKQHAFLIDEQNSIQCSCSMGFSQYPFFVNEPDTLTWEEAVILADHALYVAKHSGRDAWVGFKATPLLNSKQLSSRIGEQLKELVNEGQIAVQSSLKVPEEIVLC